MVYYNLFDICCNELEVHGIYQKKLEVHGLRLYLLDSNIMCLIVETRFLVMGSFLTLILVCDVFANGKKNICMAIT